MMKKATLLVLSLTGVLLINCTNSNKPKNSEESALDVKMDKPTSNKFEASFSTPSPEEVLLLFESSEIVCNTKALNNPANVDKYLSSKSLSYNLGVYVTDAAYLNLFEQYAAMTSYLESIFAITDKLEINGIYQEFDFKKVFMEMDKPDSLIALSEGVFHAITNYMIDTENESMLCLISFGSFIELLYVTLESVPKFDSNNPFFDHIADQNMQLNNLYEFAMQYSENKDIKEMLTYLEKIQNVWSEFEYQQNETVVTKKAEGKISISGGLKHTFTESEYLKLKAVIKEVRTKIIS